MSRETRTQCIKQVHDHNANVNRVERRVLELPPHGRHEQPRVNRGHDPAARNGGVDPDSEVEHPLVVENVEPGTEECDAAGEGDRGDVERLPEREAVERVEDRRVVTPEDQSSDSFFDLETSLACFPIYTNKNLSSQKR
jgi:hypothetical protein